MSTLTSDKKRSHSKKLFLHQQSKGSRAAPKAINLQENNKYLLDPVWMAS